MRLAFDSQLFLKGNKTGIAWYADHLLREVLKAGEYECLCNYFSLRYDEEKTDCVTQYREAGAVMNPCPWFHDVIYKLIWPVVPLPYRWFFGGTCGITQFFNYAVPPGVKGKTVTCVYDMAYKAYPETVRLKTRRWLELVLKRSCERADVIITISEFSREQIIKYLKVPAGKIRIVPCGVDLERFHPGYGEAAIEEVKRKLGIFGEYFLYLGTLEPRKNIERLIKAYALLREAAGGREEVPDLVLSGGKGWMYESIFGTVRELKLEESVRFTGYVSEEDKPCLLSGAKAFVFPSLYEGFGMPPLEAMACGTPVITSNVSSLPEVAGGAGILVNPESPEEICRAMKETLLEEKRREMREKGVERAGKFTWENSARALLSIYREII